MIPRVIASIVLANLHGSAALSQTTTPSPPAQPTKPAIEAPVGHRQPRAADVPTDKENRPVDKLEEEQRRLDRALRNICRGC